jgi:hypothetical protein
VIDNNAHFEVLAHDADHRTESRGQLPIQLIIQHVQEDDGLIPHANLVIPQKLNEQFLNQVQLVLVVGDLGE